jgi:hypothetical protein
MRRLIILFFISLYRIFARLFGVHRCHGILKDLIEIAEKEEKIFVTYHTRPAKSSATRTRNDSEDHNRNLSLILQGPIMPVGAFTLETIKLYKRLFGDANIILSTWEDEDNLEIRRIKDLGIDVVLNRKPAYSGHSNINLQIVSSRAGVEKAKESGAKYVLKTRTDQRIYAPDVARFLENLTDVFPVRGGNGLQKKRIVGASLNTFKYRLYGLSDMVIYGDVDDMSIYWGADLDLRVFSEEFIGGMWKSLRHFANSRVCEVYLATEFLQKVGHVPKWTLTDSFRVFSDRFCVVDKEQLDLFWPKYSRQENRYVSYTGEFNAKEEITYRDWLNIYNGHSDMTAQEHLLDVPL